MSKSLPEPVNVFVGPVVRQGLNNIKGGGKLLLMMTFKASPSSRVRTYRGQVVLMGVAQAGQGLIYSLRVNGEPLVTDEGFPDVRPGDVITIEVPPNDGRCELPCILRWVLRK